MNALAAEEAASDRFKIERNDCLSFLRTLSDSTVDLIVTDPAYSGMNQHLQLGRGRIVGHYRSAGSDGSKWFAEFSDDPETFRTFLQECHRVMRRDRHLYIMFDSYSLLTLGHVVRDVFNVKGLIVWDKVNLGMGHYFRRRHETIMLAAKGQRKLSRRNIPDVWQIKRLYRAHYPTQKPVELFRRMVDASAEPGFLVCDPFVGSGSSAVAALGLDCSFLGADVARRAVEIAQMRCRHFIETGADPLEGPSSTPQARLPIA